MIRLPKSYLVQEGKKGVILPDALPVEGDFQDDWEVECEEMQYSDYQISNGHSGGNTPQPAQPTPPPKKHFWKKLLLRLAAVLVVLGLVAGGLLISYLKRATVNDFLWLSLEQLPYRDATILYAQHRETGEWEEYDTLRATQQRIWVPLSEIPLDLQHAFVAVEDRDFYKHSGVSWKRTIFAGLNEVKKILTGTYFGGEEGIKQGASTIDQQLIKNLLGDDEAGGFDGYMRKVREIWRALELDRNYEKDVILEAYLNVIGMTGNTAGVQAESIKLFNKPVSELSLAQCASLAAITKNPSRYDPVRYPENNISRRNYILQEMYEQGYITKAEYDTACAEPLNLEPGTVEVQPTGVTSWFTDEVIEDVSEDLMREYGLTNEQVTSLLYDGGLRIYTTVDPELQRIMEEKMTGGAFFGGPGIAGTQPVYDEEGNPVLDENGEQVTEKATEYPEAAMVSIDYTGRLCAVVGSVEEKEFSRAFNRGTDALRQVGSTMKPIGPYVLALENNKINWSTPLLDAPVRDEVDEKTGETKPWPANVTLTYTQDDILVADAMAQSVNTVAVRVGELVGSDNIYDFVTDSLHITSFTEKDRDLGPMVLGSSTYGVTPYELAGAYMMFGSGGTFTTLHSYESVQTGTGKELLTPVIETEQVISSDTAWVMNRMLKGVMEGAGTASGYALSGGMESVGKTGTSSDNRDFWFVGMTPYYVTATWYGYDSGASLNLTNGTQETVRAWRSVMQEAQRNLPQKEFPPDSSVQELKYCVETGELAGDTCWRTKTGYYRTSDVPQLCTKHAS